MDREPPIRAGRYLLHGVIGAGGNATVHLGVLEGAAGFQRVVAIKRLYPHFAKNPEFVEKFLDEAKLVTRIHHPNVVATHDVVVDGGECLVVMEYVPGETLSRLLQASIKKDALPSPAIVAAIVCDLLRGLRAAHDAKDESGELLGIVHRDVSPQNVLVGSDGFTRLLDFGTAKVVDQTSLTPADQMRGKLAYLSPEQQRGGRATKQSDVFSAAIVLWESLAGRRLFLDETDVKTRENVLNAEIAPPSTFSSSVSAALDQVTMRGLERNLDDRYSSAKEMLDALEAAVVPATAQEVGAWVDSLAHDALAHRSEVARAVEGVPIEEARDRTRTAVEAPIPKRASTASPPPTKETTEPTSRGLPRMLLVAACFAAIASLVALEIAIRSRAKPQPIASEPPVTSQTAPPAASSAEAPAPLASASETRPHDPKPHSRTPTTHSHCNPPFVYDASGHKMYKPECF